MRFSGVLAMVLVQDVERAARFYRDTLGFTVQEEEEDWIVFNEGVGLHAAPELLPESSVALNAVQITLLVDDVQGAYADLIQKGVAFFVAPTDEGSARFASFRDTEGNLLQLMQLH